ncbi:MAG: methanogenesis marker protein Mmp4/MtxX [Candidatus Lokiarchaeota archaeon]|jgi:putative methanogen marker protein 4|nr:methanogenesis marker protein Mmp4/MtxX [Candidatus Lokiarchaeota archaeon]
MTILDAFRKKTEGVISKIGIGLGDSATNNIKILNAVLEILKLNKSSFFFFGNKKRIEEIAKSQMYKENERYIVLIDSNDPTSEILHYLNKNLIACAVRGSLSSSKFLKNLDVILNISDINRLALLETSSGHQFFFGPVGIDECNNLNSKEQFIEKALKVLSTLHIEPKISVLSGGRLGDIGRNVEIDKSIKEAKELVDYFKLEKPDLEIEHSEILIETAIENKSNLILAPNGIAGNLIYRTLVHLGGGKAYGAIYMGIDYKIVDTSRVGDFTEIYGGLILALALSN